ncbi:MAG: hypothetical protein ABEH38_05275 [Flavobacteriales bacterium]
MRSLLLSIPLSLFTFLAVPAQKDELLFRLEKEHESFRTDELDNIYLIDGVEISMWNKEGKHQYDYSKNSLGSITDVDLSRALKPLVFYAGLSTLVVLDNTLSVQGRPVDLSRYGLDQAELVCNSVNSHYWFYDGSRNELIRTDRSFRKVLETGDLVRILNMRIAPTQMVEFRERLYLNAPSQGILVFDIFGSHLKTLPIKNAKHFQVSTDYIHFMRDSSYYSYNRTTHESERLPLPEDDVESVRTGKKRLYISNGKSVSVYKSQREKLPQKESKVDPKGDR